MKRFGIMVAVAATILTVDAGRSASARERMQDPSGTRASGGKVLFADDIRSTTWNPIKDDTCAAVQGDGGYIVRGASSTSTCRIHLSFAGVFSGDLRIEMTARLRQGALDGLFGIIFAAQDDVFHKFAVSGNGYYVLNHIANSVWSNLVGWTASPAIQQGRGATNRLVVEVRGRRIQVFVNGQLLNTAAATYDLKGKIGFFVNELNQEVVFSDVRVTDLSAPSTTPTTTAPPKLTLTSGGRIVVDDDMATSQNFAVGRNGDCVQEYAEGGYVVESPSQTGGCVVFLFNAGDHPVYLRYEVSARVIKGGEKGYGLLFGKSSNEVYVLAVTHGILTGTYELGRTAVVAGKSGYTALIPVSGAAGVHTGAGSTNRLAVEINGRDVRLFVNGAFLQSYTTPTAPQGQVGIGAVGGARIVFSNFRVTDFVAPQTTGGFPRRAGESVASVERTLLRGAAESMSFGSASGGPRQAESARSGAIKDTRR